MTAAVLADALWRAMVYVSVCQLHLRDNVLLAEPLAAEHVKRRPAGHWGTVPGTAWALAHVDLCAGRGSGTAELVPLLGAGHAGVVQLAAAWVTGALAEVREQFSRDEGGLRSLARAFPDVDGLGGEVHPALPAGAFLGGRLGGCLPFAQGIALDAPGRIAVPIIGDGECETPTTAASWSAQAALPGAMVLPIVHVNGFGMGRPSLLGALDDEALADYFQGLGWETVTVRVEAGTRHEHDTFQFALRNAVQRTLQGRRTAVLLRCMKGWGGPASLHGRVLLGTPGLHKTPLSDPRTDSDQLAALAGWLASYRPWELFGADGHLFGVLTDAVEAARCQRPSIPEIAHDGGRGEAPKEAASFTEAVTAVVRARAERGAFRVFSPDELASNRLPGLTDEPWTVELLAEEVLVEWLAGWTSSGR